MQGTIRIIGIDPGLRRTGWGVIEAAGSRLSYVASGTILPETGRSLAERLAALHAALSTVVGDHRPAEAAIEETFVNKDAAATLKLGAARGVALLVPAQISVPVAEYAPNQVKKTVVGAGHAGKDQIRMMVKVLLPQAAPKTADEADALAIAICHAQWRGAAARQAAGAAR